MNIRIEVISGPEGPCLGFFTGDIGQRICGPKPWGGGKTLHCWEVDADELKEAVAAARRRLDLMGGHSA